MNENEAIERIKYRMHTAGQVAGENGMEDLEMAIKALEEIQKYHAIGTPEELITAMKYVRLAKAHRTVGRAIEECAKYEEIGTPEELQDMKNNYFEALSDWRQYRKIGTLEEVRAAVEKQTAKKVKSISQVKDGDSYVGLIGRCPCCGDILEEDTVYCDCGQRLDWGTSDEID